MNRFQKRCACCLLLILLFLCVYSIPCAVEGLHNEGTGESNESVLHTDRGAVPYNDMYTYLTVNNPDHSFYVGKDICDIIQEPPYSYMDFKSNLDEDTVFKDFQYFNNASAITAGHTLFQS